MLSEGDGGLSGSSSGVNDSLSSIYIWSVYILAISSFELLQAGFAEFAGHAVCLRHRPMVKSRQDAPFFSFFDQATLKIISSGRKDKTSKYHHH